jgi:hypothetical protein
MREQKYKVKGRSGEELCVYLPDGKIAEVDEARGQYFTRSKFVLWALDRAIEEIRTSGILRLKNKMPQGATVSSPAPSGVNNTVLPNNEATQEQEGLIGVG